jgi:hypothetical protein
MEDIINDETNLSQNNWVTTLEVLVGIRLPRTVQHMATREY